MKIFILYFLISLISFPLFAQWQSTNGPYGGTINCLASNSNLIFAGTTNGVVLSKNRGDTWIEIGLLNKSITALLVVNNDVFAGTSEGEIHLYSIENNSWRELNTDSITTPISTFVTCGTNIFVGTKGEGIFCSKNSGESWISWNDGLSSNPTFRQVHCLSYFNSKLLATTSNGFYMGDCTNANWVKTNGALTHIVVSGKNLIGGNQGEILLSDDTCASWKSVKMGIYVKSLIASDSNVYVGTWYGDFFTSHDYGLTWTQHKISLSEKDILSITVLDSNVYVGTSGSGIFRANISSFNWKECNQGLNKNKCNSMNIANTGLVAATNSGVFISHDKGVSWSQVLNSHYEFTSSHSIGNDLYIGSSAKGVFYSPDNGNTWTNRSIGLSSSIYHDCGNCILSMANIDDHIFVGTQNGIFVSNNKGISWSTEYIGWGNYIRDFEIKDKILYAIISQNLLKVSNKGDLLEEIHLDNNLNSIDVIEMNDYYLFTGGYKNGVNIYSRENNELKFYSNSFKGFYVKSLAYDENILFAGTDSGIYVSNNLGYSWVDISAGLSNLDILFTTIYDGYLYVGTSGGGIWKRSLTELKSIEHDDFIFYPNPSNNRINIKLEKMLPYFETQFSIYNIQGKLVHQQFLYKEETEIDISKFECGIYILKIFGNNNVVSKKLIITPKN